MNFYENLVNNFSKVVADQISKALNEERVYSLYLNTNKMTRREFYSRFPDVHSHPLVDNGFYYDKKQYDFGRHYLHDLGVYYIQEPAAMSIVSLLNIRPGDYVLDMCAAPGGKTLQAALKVTQEGVVLANDISHSRALTLSQNVERMGMRNIIVVNNNLADIYPFYLNTFDKIILDAPCSGSGMFRKDEKMIDDWSYHKVLTCKQSQIALLELAYAMLKPGGTIAYSTCSFSKEENEDVVNHLLTKSDAYLLEINEFLGIYRSLHLQNAIYFLPSLFKGEGQFLALIKKPGKSLKTKYVTSSYKGRYQTILQQYNLIHRHNREIGDSLYSLNWQVNTDHLNVIRYGVRAFDDINKTIKPHHHLAHYLDASQSISLDESSFRKYLAGETLNYQIDKGYHLVSYQQVNVGFVRSANNTLKNLLPKGLRRRSISG